MQALPTDSNTPRKLAWRANIVLATVDGQRSTEILRQTKPKMLVGITLANKMARQIRAMLTKNEDYRDPALATA